MRIAFLTSIVPDGHPTSGYEIANEAVVDGLVALGHEVVSVGFALPRQKPAREGSVVLATLDLENANAGALRQAGFVARALATGLPVSASKLRAVSAATAARSYGRAGPFDAVIANSYQMASAFPNLMPDRYGFLAHNVEHVSAAENARSGSGGLRRALYARDARLLSDIETGLCERAAWVWTLSADDLSTLCVQPGSGCTLPLVTPDSPVRPTAERRYDVGMIGTWSWEPNRVGLAWFFEKVVPLLDPVLTIAVAGSVPDGMTAPARVAMLGRVESADAFLSSLGMVPLVSRGGTGVQLKTVEAFQAGLACVATSSALRGIDALPANCSRADDAAAFAKALNRQAPGARRIDGSPFRDAQWHALLQSLERGLDRLRL